ncbi:MAG: hydroxymethylbilane synthase, partial [Acidobacteriota bacterium]
GALAIETRSASEASEAVRALHHADSGIEAQAERALVTALGGGCQMPLGALARVRRGRLSLSAFLSEVEGRRWVRDTEEGETAEPERVARRLAARLLRTGGADILRALGLQPPQLEGLDTE